MKPLLPLLILLFYAYNVTAQKIRNEGSSVTGQSILNPLNPQNRGRCASDDLLQQVLNKFPAYNNTVKTANRLLNDEIKKRIDRRFLKIEQETAALPIDIPVVVHIVMQQPAAITDAAVQAQLDRLNLDFSGLNTDSTNLAPMYPYGLRGHSNIRFTLAKRDARNNATSGIERRWSNVFFTAEAEDPIKLTAYGGLDAWDPARYLNIWVGNTNYDGLLGYSTYPFSVANYVQPPKQFHGIVMNEMAFANNTRYYAFNRGRTLVHEIGHYFGLFHTFQGGCSNQDFSTAAFDAGNNDDTPFQSNATGTGGTNTCPGGTVASGCTGNTSGRLYQNYMDYTDDPCMTMFTANQVIRMETALDMFYPSLKTSDGATAPVVYANDVQLLGTKNPDAANRSDSQPDNSSGIITFCSNVNPLTITPLLQIRNSGSNPLMEVEVWYKRGDSAAVFSEKIIFVTAIPSLDTALIQLKSISLFNGTYPLQLFTIKPNNNADENPLNDTLQMTLSVELPQSTAVVEGFEDAGFPPQGWKVQNELGDNYTWQKTNVAYKSGQASIFINHFDYEQVGRIDDLVTPAVDIAVADSILFSFERAYKVFDSTFKDYSDTLEILISEDCGSGFKSVWKYGGSGLATVQGQTGLFSWAPTASDWKKTTLDLRPFVSGAASSVRVIFRAKNGFGQNLYLDDIHLEAIFRSIRDARIVTVSEPAFQVCGSQFTPRLIIENRGEDTLRKLTVSYTINGGAPKSINWSGNLKKFQRETVSFATVNTGGYGKLDIVFTISSPNGLEDQNKANDTVNRRVMVFNMIDVPLVEGFENTTFPPAGWDVTGSGEPFRWARSTSASSEKIGAAWVNNNKNTDYGSVQDLYTPVIRVGSTDSLMVRFDLAHVTTEYPVTTWPTDTLQVLLTTDCGKTFTSIYKKWGAQLNTLKLPYPGISSRDSIGFMPNLRSHWRTDSIDIRSLLSGAASFQLIFRNINNNDNNLFLDNIRVNQVILPDRLKEKGFQLLPNPTTGIVYIWHSSPPMNLQGLQVVNSRGLVILTQRFKQNAPSSIPLDLTSQAAGLYTVRLLYKDYSVTEKIIKIN